MRSGAGAELRATRAVATMQAVRMAAMNRSRTSARRTSGNVPAKDAPGAERAATPNFWLAKIGDPGATRFVPSTSLTRPPIPDRKGGTMKSEIRLRRLEAKILADPVILYCADGSTRELRGHRNLLVRERRRVM